MTKPIEPPKSWRDLTHAELIALLDEAIVFQMMLRPRDLVWAQWKIASADHIAASEAEQQAWTASHQAYREYAATGTSKVLAAREQAEARHKRAKAAYERAVKRADALYALHEQLCEAER